MEYQYAKRVIARGSFDPAVMGDILSTFLQAHKITQDQFNELMDMMAGGN
ncbi:MAG: hypothetical protein GXY67_07850 [Clostridiales bacterium]|nr:hypothetical protein [Clostridiales bacterium]